LIENHNNKQGRKRIQQLRVEKGMAESYSRNSTDSWRPKAIYCPSGQSSRKAIPYSQNKGICNRWSPYKIHAVSKV